MDGSIIMETALLIVVMQFIVVFLLEVEPMVEPIQLAFVEGVIQ
jgi:hypothetical protein